ncbi:MAG: hypothetical protein Q8P02_04740 [Candidatus Micrarchaeota archaeon]|nr:hypothetical protein [Candidatus Micrarchaeota archaeon]
MAPWRIAFKPDWDVHFKAFDKKIQERILKKIAQMKQPIVGRGLHGTSYCVEEVGQYRIAFEQDSASRTKSIHFVGNHKQYERWYRSRSG